MTPPVWLIVLHEHTYRPWMMNFLNGVQVAAWIALAALLVWACR